MSALFDWDKTPAKEYMVFRESFKITPKSAQTLMNCPVDVFFVSNRDPLLGQLLHGTSLKALAKQGYLNAEFNEKTRVVEYYVNSNGHRLIAKLTKYLGQNKPAT